MCKTPFYHVARTQQEKCISRHYADERTSDTVAFIQPSIKIYCWLVEAADSGETS